MKETLELTCTPTGEECENLGPNYNPQKARAECRAFKNQLERESPPPGEAYLKIKSNPHDFGSYLEVAAVFNPENEQEADWAYGLESELPEFWDEIARQELGLVAK